MKSELQKAKEKAAKEKAGFSDWLWKKVQQSPWGTQSRLAEYLGVERPHISDYVSGKRVPHFLTRQKIRKFFDKKA